MSPAAESDLLFLLHDVARLMRVEVDKRARAFNMTRAQWVLLIRLERQPGLSQKELAELLEVEPITVARLVDRLEAHAMVERRPDPRDRRIWRLHLLPAARDLLGEIHRQRLAIARTVATGVPAETLAAMEAGLRTMKATLCAEVRGTCRAELPATVPAPERSGAPVAEAATIEKEVA